MGLFATPLSSGCRREAGELVVFVSESHLVHSFPSRPPMNVLKQFFKRRLIIEKDPQS